MTTPVENDVLDSLSASRNTAHGAALRVATFGVSMLVSVVSVRLMTRHLGPIDWGSYSIVTAITFVLVGSSEAGLTSIGLREGAGLDTTARSRLVSNILGLRIALTIAGIVCAVVFAAATGRPSTIVLGVGVVGVGTLLTMTQQTLAIKLSLELRNGAIAALELVRNLALSAANIAMVEADSGLNWFYLGPVVAGIVTIAAMAAFMRSSAWFRPRLDRREWRRILRSVVPYAMAGALGLLYFRVAQITMSYVATGTETGLYGLGFRVIEVLGAIPSLVAVTALPLVSRAVTAGTSRLRPLVQVLADSATLAGITLAFAVAAGGRLAVSVLGDATYSGAVPVLHILAIGLAFTFPLTMLSILLISLERYRALVVCGSSAAVLSLALTTALVPTYGARGAAVATVLTEACLTGLFLAALVRSRRDLVPSPRRSVRALAACVPGVAVLAVTLSHHGYFAPFLALPVFVTAAVLLGAVPPELRDVVTPTTVRRPT